MSWRIVYTHRAAKDAKKLSKSDLNKRCKELLDVIREDPFKVPPLYEKLEGNLSGLCARRINIQQRLVYHVYEEERVIKVVSMWSHYE